MLIRYVVTRHEREVRDAVAQRLIAAGLAVAVEPVEPETPKRKRTYRRRDMVAES